MKHIAPDTILTRFPTFTLLPTCLCIIIILFSPVAYVFAVSGDILSIEKQNGFLRSGPGLHHSVITRLKKSQKVHEKLRRNSWIAIEVVDSGKVGWIHISLLDSSVAPPEIITEPGSVPPVVQAKKSAKKRISLPAEQHDNNPVALIVTTPSEKQIDVQTTPVNAPPLIDIIVLDDMISPGKSKVYSLDGQNIDFEDVSFIFTDNQGKEITPVVYGLSLILENNRLSISAPLDGAGKISLQNIQIRVMADGILSKNFIALPETISVIPAVSPHPSRPREATGQKRTAAATGASGEEHFSRAGEYLDEGKHKLAVDEFRKAIQAGNKHPLLYFDLAGALYEIGELDDALKEMSTAVALAPSVTFFHSNLGMLYFMKGDAKNAEIHFHEAIRLNLGQADAYSYLAKISFSRKNYRSAWLLTKMANSLGFHEAEFSRKLLEKSEKPDIVPWKVEEDIYYLRAILVDSSGMAEMLMDRLHLGEPFELLAAGQEKAVNAFSGGYLGAFELDELHPTLAESVKKLDVMGSSVIVKADSGFHILQRIAPFNNNLLSDK